MHGEKILVTCFEPFGNNERNTSFEAVTKMSASGGVVLKKLCLPVTWNGALRALTSEIDSFSPDAVLMTGLASGSEHIRVERVGINLCGAIKDNDGNLPSQNGERPIYEGGESAFFSTFDYAKILECLKASGIKSAYSFSAGTYICNYVLYGALKKLNDEKKTVRAGFIHVPDAAEFVPAGKPSMSLDMITRAVEIAAENM